MDRQIMDRIRHDRHHVFYVVEMISDISKGDVIEMTNREEAVLLTVDKGFGELLFRQRLTKQGVVLIRLAGLSPTKKAETVVSAVKNTYGIIGT